MAMSEHKNKVELLGFYGSDSTHACSAWTSTNRDLTPEKIERIPVLLKRLALDGHHTPFEKSMLHFLVTCDTASHIHLLKHRISVSINTESARYKELKDDKFYIPDDWPEEAKEILTNSLISSYKLYHYITNLLQVKGYSKKRAKESARYFLPYANQLTMDVSFNCRSFFHFQDLRNTSVAQVEIRNIADDMLNLVRKIPGNPFQHTLNAFGF